MIMWTVHKDILKRILIEVCWFKKPMLVQSPVYPGLSFADLKDFLPSLLLQLHFGVNSGAPKFAIEQQAVNEATFRCPDELGWQPQVHMVLCFRAIPLMPLQQIILILFCLFMLLCFFLYFSPASSYSIRRWRNYPGKRGTLWSDLNMYLGIHCLLDRMCFF